MSHRSLKIKITKEIEKSRWVTINEILTYMTTSNGVYDLQRKMKEGEINR